MPEITLVEAVTQALAYELEKDSNVVVFGEDVGLNGGVFRATDGLQKQFGETRVFDTPLAESMIAGLAVGMLECRSDGGPLRLGACLLQAEQWWQVPGQDLVLNAEVGRGDQTAAAHHQRAPDTVHEFADVPGPVITLHGIKGRAT